MSYRTRRAWTLLWGLVVPHSFVLIARALRNRLLAARRLERFDARVQPAREGVTARSFDYEEGVRLLATRGADEEAVRSGSIQDASLRFIRTTVRERLASDAPPHALHVGNFVGLSLASLTGALVERDPRAIVVSIDPNITHVGIADTQSHTLALLSHFGLQRNSVLVCGYSLEKVLGNDAVSVEGYDPARAFTAEHACEDTLASLARLQARFSVVVMDGHHDAAYLRRELELVGEMLAHGGLLFLDDVSVVWKGIRELFRELGEDSSWDFEQVGYDGRIGALRKRAGERQGPVLTAAVSP